MPAYSQETKPDEAPKKSVLRAGLNGVGIPTCVYCPVPELAEKAGAAKLHGSVLLDVTVTIEGAGKDITLIKASDQRLEAKAMEAVQSWKLAPAKDVAGKAVEVRTRVEVSFRVK